MARIKWKTKLGPVHSAPDGAVFSFRGDEGEMRVWLEEKEGKMIVKSAISGKTGRPRLQQLMDLGDENGKKKQRR